MIDGWAGSGGYEGMPESAQVFLIGAAGDECFKIKI